MKVALDLMPPLDTRGPGLRSTSCSRWPCWRFGSGCTSLPGVRCCQRAAAFFGQKLKGLSGALLAGAMWPRLSGGAGVHSWWIGCR
eukprot:3819948-Alexandrium_andersonii.AAC.1